MPRDVNVTVFFGCPGYGDHVCICMCVCVHACERDECVKNRWNNYTRVMKYTSCGESLYLSFPPSSFFLLRRSINVYSLGKDSSKESRSLAREHRRGRTTNRSDPKSGWQALRLSVRLRASVSTHSCVLVARWKSPAYLFRYRERAHLRLPPSRLSPASSSLLLSLSFLPPPQATSSAASS